jgi:AmmeMemoRadiSam system protein B
MPIRPAAVAGTWYPGTAGALTREVDQYLAAAADGPRGAVRAVLAPHAGIMFSGPVAAYGYRNVASHGPTAYDVAVLVGPSHFVDFEGVSIFPEGAFETPLGPVSIDAETAAAIAAQSDVVHALPRAHAREHSLEMQLPFFRRLFPDVPIVPLLMGRQERDTIDRLGAALTAGLSQKRALLVASSDLSHYFDARTAGELDGRVLDCLEPFDDERLMALFERYPPNERGRHVGCGIGPALAVMQAARALGADEGRVLKYGHSGDISGDLEGVVGYAAAVFGRFDAE